jgi:polysaccharide export outer membrane protein
MNRRAVLSLIAAMPLAACARPPSPVFEEAGAAPYALGTGDKLRVIVFGQDNLSNVYAVDSVGRISMPLVDVIPVAGLTTQQAERAIEARLRNGFIREPRVAVEIDTFRPFYILGEVVTPGQYPYVNGLTIQKAAAIASGFTPRGDQYNAEITRQVKGGIVVATVPITYPIRPGDTIVIKERWF